MRDFPFWPPIFVVVFCAMLGALIWAMVHETAKERAEWRTFATQHNCKVAQRTQSRHQTSYGYGIQSNGKHGYGIITTHVPAQTAYSCDDGVTYWRQD